LATIETIESEGLVERAETLGAILKRGLEDVKKANPELISEVRGVGLMLGVEFSMDEVGELCIGQMTKRGLIAAYTLNNPRVIRFEPPLIVNEAQIGFAVETFGAAVKETAEILAEL
jgi:putrescine aminotransferase